MLFEDVPLEQLNTDLNCFKDQCILEVQVTLPRRQVGATQMRNIVSAAEAALEQNPSSHNAFVVCVWDLSRQKNWRAMERLARAKKAADNRALGYQILAIALAEQGRYDEALAVVQKPAHDLKDGYDPTLQTIEGSILLAKGQTERAIETLDGVWRYNRGNIVAGHNLALALLRDDRQAAALQVLRACAKTTSEYEIYSDALNRRVRKLVETVGR